MSAINSIQQFRKP